MRTLSHGEQRQLEIARSLMHDPVLLLIDEPTAGVSMEEIPPLLEVISTAHRVDGKTVRRLPRGCVAVGAIGALA